MFPDSKAQAIAYNDDILGWCISRDWLMFFHDADAPIQVRFTVLDIIELERD